MDDIDALEAPARAYCEALGLDPDEIMSCGVQDICTEKEVQDDFPNGVFPAGSLQEPRWQLYRRAAQANVAAEAAITVRQGEH